MVKGKDWKRWKEVFSFTFYSIQIWSSLDPSIYSTCTALSPLLFVNYLCPFLFLWKFWPFHLAVKIDRKFNEVKETFLLTTFLLVPRILFVWYLILLELYKWVWAPIKLFLTFAFNLLSSSEIGNLILGNKPRGYSIAQKSF